MDKLDFSKPDELQTQDGRQVRIYATDGMGLYSIHGAIKNDGGWMQERWDDEGKNYLSVHRNHLVRKPPRVTGWVNVYQQPNGVYATSNVFKSQTEAREVSSIGCVGQIYINAQIQT